MCMYVHVCMAVCRCVCESECLKRTGEVSDPLELKLQAVVSHPEWLLGTKPGSLQPRFLLI